MKNKTVLALIGAIAIATASAGGALAAASAGPAVTVRIKSLTKTLLMPTSVHGEKGSITKGGTPAGTCPGKSAAGALDAATNGHWKGKYFSSVPGIFITSILGVKPPGKDFWSISVNGNSNVPGICAIKLHAGDKLLFKIVK
jgi:hypothetical protein